MSITVHKGSRSEILSIDISSGQILYASDTKEVFYDNTDGTRMITTSIIPFTTNTEMELCNDPEPDKVYLLVPTSKVYQYAGEWIELEEQYQITEILFDCTILTPIVMSEGDIPVAPASIASNVFMSDGRTVESVLAELMSLGVVTTDRINGTLITPYSIPTNRLQSTTNKIDEDSDVYIPTSKALNVLTQQVNSLVSNGIPVVTTKMNMTTASVPAVIDGQIKFKIPDPFDNYKESGGKYLVFDGPLYMDESRYSVVKDTFDTDDHIVIPGFYTKKGDALTFIFFYNTSSGNGALDPDASHSATQYEPRFKELYFNNHGCVDITYGNGLFVTLSDIYTNEMISTTTTGEEWKKQIVSMNNIWTSICFGNDTFVAVGYNSDNTNCVAVSNDGINWIMRSASENTSKWIDVTYGDGKFVAIAESSITSRKNIMVSVDNGQNWVSVRSPISDNPKKIIYGNGRFVIIGEKYMLISSNGINWNPIDRTVTDMYYKDGRFFYIVADRDSRSCFGYTTDFITYKDSPLKEDRYPYQICGDGTYMYILCDYNGSVNDVVVTDGFNMLHDTLIESEYEYNKFRFAYGNGLLIGIKPDENIAIVSGSPTIPELYKILSK